MGKKVLGTLAVVAAVGGSFYLIKKGKKLLSGAKMNFALLGFCIHKLDFQEIQFAVKLRCYNPPLASINLAVNQVVAKYKGSAIAYFTPDIDFNILFHFQQRPKSKSRFSEDFFCPSEAIFITRYKNLKYKSIKRSYSSFPTWQASDSSLLYIFPFNEHYKTLPEPHASQIKPLVFLMYKSFHSMHYLQ